MIYHGPNVSGGGKTFTVTPSDPLIIDSSGICGQITVSVKPDVGASLTFAYQMSSGEKSELWFPILDGNLAGTVTVATADIVQFPMSAIRVTANSGSAIIGISW